MVGKLVGLDKSNAVPRILSIAMSFNKKVLRPIFLIS